MSFEKDSEQFVGWEEMEAIHSIAFQDKAPHDQIVDVVGLARDICFSSDEFKVTGPESSSKERAAKFVVGACYVTLVALDTRLFPDMDVTIDERDQPGRPLIVRDRYEFNNSAHLRRKHPKISVVPSQLFYVSGTQIDLEKALPKQPAVKKYSYFQENTKWRFNRALKRTSVTTSHFTRLDQARLMGLLLSIRGGIDPYDVGDDALTTQHLV